MANVEREGARLTFDVLEPGDAISLVILHKTPIRGGSGRDVAIVNAHIVGGQVREATSSYTMLGNRVKAELPVSAPSFPGVSGGTVLWPPLPAPPTT